MRFTRKDVIACFALPITLLFHLTVVHCIVFISYKKIHCIIVRGACFSPAAVECLSQYLRVTKNNMIMGESCTVVIVTYILHNC